MTELHVRTPFVAPGNEYFFDDGGDGNLRIKRCQDCSHYIHPPKPICDKCRSTNVVPEVVSGRGILFGYSVNVHFSMPGCRSRRTSPELSRSRRRRTSRCRA